MKLILRYWWVSLAPAMPVVAMFVNHTIVLTDQQRIFLAAGCVLLSAGIGLLAIQAINRRFVESERAHESQRNLQQALKERAR
jgi:hypothetical protein